MLMDACLAVWLVMNWMAKWHRVHHRRSRCCQLWSGGTLATTFQLAHQVTFSPAKHTIKPFLLGGAGHDHNHSSSETAESFGQSLGLTGESGLREHAATGHILAGQWIHIYCFTTNQARATDAHKHRFALIHFLIALLSEPNTHTKQNTKTIQVKRTGTKQLHSRTHSFIHCPE